MQRPLGDHRALPFLVHELVPDFELMDVWRFPIEIEDELPLEAFLAHLRGSMSGLSEQSGPAAWLFQLREWLGQLFGWDDGPKQAVPGCTELSVRERLTPPEDPPEGFADAFEGVYARDDEILFEISNATVHALLHLGRAPAHEGHWAPQIAIYSKTRGLLGRAYLAAIAPFRHGIVYPAVMRAVSRSWAERAVPSSQS